MSSIYLTVEPMLGHSIDDVCRDAVALANKVGLPVRFRFNGVRTKVCPGDNPSDISSAWSTKYTETSPVQQ